MEFMWVSEWNKRIEEHVNKQMKREKGMKEGDIEHKAS